MIINSPPYIKISLVVHDSPPAIIAIWGIEGGVAKAKLAIIPIKHITVSILKVEFIATKIDEAT